MKSFIFYISIFFAIPCMGQLSSSDIKDASASGPFPIYFGIDYTNSFKSHKDFTALNNRFTTTFSNTANQNKRLFGLSGHIGFVWKKEESKLPALFFEVEYLYLKRTSQTGGQHFAMTIRQMSFQSGIRVTNFYPVNFQFYVGTNFHNTRKFTFDQLNRSIQLPNDKKFFDDIKGALRITLLDPAGTEGGLGLYFEWAYHAFDLGRSHCSLTSVVQVFNPAFSDNLHSEPNYFSFSFGIVAPLALTIK